MKRIILILLTTLTISSYVHAEDISYYRIDGMKVGDSLLDYLSEKAIIGNFGRDNGIFVQTGMYGKTYDYIAINYLKDDKDYIIHEISGRTNYENDECLKIQEGIVEDISNQVLDESVQIDNKGVVPFGADSTGDSKMNVVNFYFSNGLIHVACYNFSDAFSTEIGVSDFINISVGSSEWFNWQIENSPNK